MFTFSLMFFFPVIMSKNIMYIEKKKLFGFIQKSRLKYYVKIGLQFKTDFFTFLILLFGF